MKSHALDRTDNSISQLSNDLSQCVILFLFLRSISVIFSFLHQFLYDFFFTVRVAVWREKIHMESTRLS